MKKALKMSMSNVDLPTGALWDHVFLPDVDMVFPLSKGALLRSLVLTIVIRELMT